jgi:GT2 family glycosyltransferase
MNSDILPSTQGWLRKMLFSYTARKHCGTLAPKLLYADGAIQHAGMYFSLNSTREYYENLHYYKGYPAAHPPACVSCDVPAVSGACMLINTALFREVGMLSTRYLIGDYEDSDLCLRLAQQGYTHRYLASVELYHYERQSFATLPSSATLRYHLNATYHHRQWGEQIETLMGVYHHV